MPAYLRLGQIKPVYYRTSSTTLMDLFTTLSVPLGGCDPFQRIAVIDGGVIEWRHYSSETTWWLARRGFLL